MRGPHIVFFSSGIHQKQFEHYLLQEMRIITFPYEHNLQKKDFVNNKTVIILWHTTRSRKGLQKLKEIKAKFPKLPVFIIAEKSSQDELLKAIRYGVDNYFLTPITEEDLATAVQDALSSLSARKTNWFPFSARLLNSLGNFGKQVIHNCWKVLNGKGQAQVSLGIAPYTQFASTKPKVEGKTYDLDVRFFGDFEIKIRDKVVAKLRGRKNNALLAYLLYYHQKPISRDTLMTEFWGDFATSSARNSLNVAICSIRKFLSKEFPKQEVVLFENDAYSINPELEIITDVEQFTYFWNKGRTIEKEQGLNSALRAYNKAFSIYREDFLTDMTFEEWCESERDNLKETCLFILNRLSSYFFEIKDYDACINIGKKMLEKDPCFEEVHRKLMKCYYALGLSDLALKQFFKCKKTLNEFLQIEPSELSYELLKSIQNGRSLRA